MSADRIRVRSSSIVGLYRDVTIESLPIEEVKADLDRLGLDPAPSIDLARRLAKGDADDPATALLRKLEEADEIDAQIANLESAPIDEIRSNLPEGLAEQASSAAKDRSAEEEKVETRLTVDRVEEANVVPVKRRRLAVLAWGGSLLGVAASVALFVAIRPYVLEQVEWGSEQRSSIERRLSVGENDQPSASDAAAESAEIAEPIEEKAVEAEASPSPIAQARRRQPKAVAASPEIDRRETVLETAVAADSEAIAIDDAAPERPGAGLEERSGLLSGERVTPSALSNQSVEAVRQALKDTTGGDQALLAAPSPAERPTTERVAQTPSHRPEVRPTPTEGELAALVTVGVERRQPAGRSSADQASSKTGVSGIPGLPNGVTGVFIVDADGVPPELWALASVRLDDRLAAKVGEASLRALGRKVLALVAFDRDGQRVEAALVESAIAPPPADLAPEVATGVTAFAGSQPPSLARSERSFELIELPGDR